MSKINLSEKHHKSYNYTVKRKVRETIMYRNVINDFVAWYEENRRRILYIKGAAGVGKTWSVKDFSKAFFDKTIYIDTTKLPDFSHAISGIISNSESDNSADSCETDMEISERITAMDNLLNQHFGEIDFSKTILIYDEVQNIPACAEFFYEYAKKHRHYSICLIASSMEITEFEFHHADVFNIIRMRPMSFEEYMLANKAHPFLAAIENHKNVPLAPLEEQAISLMLKDYLMIGGMPGIVQNFLKHKDYNEVRSMQLSQLETYRQMIQSSASSAMSQRMRRIWQSVPKQLTHNNKKFMYRFVDANARSREYADAVQHLCNLGLIRKLPRLLSSELPLEAHADYNSFELFFLDHGLLRAVYGCPINEALTLQDIFAEESGAVAEQFVFEELSSKMGYLYYWISGATARVPFVYEGESGPIPVDIRFITNKKAQNIKTFRAKNPTTGISLRISLNPVSLEDNVLNIPAYGLWNM